MTAKFDPEQHHRRSVRLEGYDYAQAGAYVVTICAHQRECLFGEIIGDTMEVNEHGRIVEEEWLQTAVVRKYVQLDEFVIMPNHFHAILFLMDNPHAAKAVGANRRFAPTTPKGTTRGSISAIMQQFKSIVTKRINEMRDTPSTPVWQRSFYESIIRDEKHLNTLRQYILYNPAKWAEDKENPVNIQKG